MHRAAQGFLGDHDFRNFCKMDVEHVVDFRRRVLSVAVQPLPGAVALFAVTGTAFLWHQVRCMAAVLLLIGAHLEDEQLVPELLDVQKRPRKPLPRPRRPLRAQSFFEVRPGGRVGLGSSALEALPPKAM